MSDHFTRLPLDRLLTSIKKEEKTDSIFGIHKDLFFKPQADDVFRLSRYKQVLESPIGVAAGPHSQLSQNIIAAWLTGARYMELKTVQVLDELDVTKPCIDMEDEGYNCEWSQELKLEESFDEYINALIAILILKKRLGHEDTDDAGFIFNMSVGYNLEGIKSPTVQRFLDKMINSSEFIKKKIKLAETIYPEASEIKVPNSVSDNITISTMHGCPPDEIEKIGRYFIEERKLNTTIKLNPTLLGPEKLRDILNTKLGFDTVVPDLAFEHDLKYDAGLALIRSLLEAAEKNGVEFNLKLTNTLETENKKGNLPEKESMLYMSGRALHAISINLAAKLQKEFNGKLNISFSAGADCFNMADILSCGLNPVTVCSDVLKPGGYGRLMQYLSETKKSFHEKQSATVSDYMKTISEGKESTEEMIVHNLENYSREVVQNKRYHKKSFPWKNIKTERELGLFDCIKAPCMETCPAGQDIPSYMRYTAAGDYEKAFRVIMQTNPFPGIQGMVCDHPCTHKCTRMNYDNSLLIREIKRFVSDTCGTLKNPEPKKDNGLSVAVIGGGPSGFSAAHFLRLNGFNVEIYESKEFAGGMAADGIPSFRLDSLRIKRDIERIEALGVQVKYGQIVDKEMFDALKVKHNFVYIAVGASEAITLDIEGADTEGVYDQLQYLSSVRREEEFETGKDIVVIGGGNSAMDAARTAKRMAGPDGNVTLLYRRTIKEMPADPEEIEALIFEGIEIKEMIAPESIATEGNHATAIRCHKMEAGNLDSSGRPRPVIIPGSLHEIKADTIITAIGQRVVVPFFPGKELLADPDTYETALENVFAGGDAIRGASTLIKAIADGRFVAENIMKKAAIRFNTGTDKSDVNTGNKLTVKKATRIYGRDLPETELAERFGFKLVSETLTETDAKNEADRCLSCDQICDVCVSVCPNRANYAYRVLPFEGSTYLAGLKNGKTDIVKTGSFSVSQENQVLNIGDYCNECGNCTTFCPTKGAPYMDKPKFYLSSEDLEQEESGYIINGDSIMKKSDGRHMSLTEAETSFVFETTEIKADFKKDTCEITGVSFKHDEDKEVDLKDAAELFVLYRSLKDSILNV